MLQVCSFNADLSVGYGEFRENDPLYTKVNCI